MRSRQAAKVSASSGAEPATNSRIRAQASRVSADSASMRTYSVGTPMNTVARGSCAITARGSKRPNQIIFAPASSAPCDATNRPCTWKIGSAWISTSSARQPQASCSTRALLSRLPCVSIAPLLRPVVPLV